MSRSTIEYEPTDFVAQLLVVEHEIPDFARKLCTLPFALKPTSFFSLTVQRRQACSFDRIRGGAELVRGHMGDGGGLSGCICRLSCRSAQLSGCCHGVTGSHSGLRHLDLPSRPSARQFDSSTRAVVSGLHFLEEVQHMLCTISRPYRKKVVMRVQ